MAGSLHGDRPVAGMLRARLHDGAARRVAGTAMCAPRCLVRASSEMSPETSQKVVETPLAEEAELHRVCREETWPRDARYQRILCVLAMVAILLGWLIDYGARGVSPRALGLLGVRALGALT